MSKNRFVHLLLILVITGSVFAGFTSAAERKRVAIVVFDGVRAIDYTGPYEVFERAGFDVYTVGSNSDYTFENAPKPDVVIIPQGNAAPGAASWIRETSRHAEQVRLRGGLSSSIDASLRVISKISGKGAAQLAALDMDYDWQPNVYSRAALADRALIRIFPRTNDWFKHLEGMKFEVLRYEGTRDRWNIVWLAIGEAAPAELLRQLDAKLSTEGMWTRQSSEGNTMQTRWTFTDDKGLTWNARSSVSPFDGQKDIHTLRLEIWTK